MVFDHIFTDWFSIMNDLDLKKLLKEHPKCINDGAKLKAILLDTYPNIPKAMLNTIVAMVNLGIVSKIQHCKTVTFLEQNRWKQKVLNEGYSENIVNECLKLFIDSIKLLDSTTSNIAKYNDNDFTIKDFVLVKYCGVKSDVKIPNGIKVIGKNAFEKSKVVSVVIPDSVLTIDLKAFFGCDKLTNITMSNNIVEIKEDAFSCCPELNSFIIPDSIRTIENYAFYGCMKFTGITIPNQVSTIGIRAFYNCFNLKLVIYQGTMAQLENIAKCFVIDDDENIVFTANVKCLDGIIPSKALPYL